MSTSETIEERTSRIIEGTRRPNFEHEGTYRVYGISYPPHKGGTSKTKPFNKTLIVENVSEKYAKKILEQIKLNPNYASGGIENNTPPYQHNN